MLRIAVVVTSMLGASLAHAQSSDQMDACAMGVMRGCYEAAGLAPPAVVQTRDAITPDAGARCAASVGR